MAGQVWGTQAPEGATQAFQTGGSSVSGGALGLNGSTNGSSLHCNAGSTGEINPERPVSLN